MSIEEVYKTIDTIIGVIKKARHDNDYNTLLLSALALLEYTPSLINYYVNQEAQYRKLEARLANETDEQGKRNTSSWCETQAKASEYYTEWQRAKRFEELIYEMVKLSKMLARSVDNEFSAT